MEFLRQQAEFFYVMKESFPGYEYQYILLPSCPHCGSDDFVEDHANCSITFDCGYSESTLSPFRAGRIAKR